MLFSKNGLGTCDVAAGRAQRRGVVQLLLYAVLVSITVFASYSLAPRIARFMGRTGINVMTRLMGLVLAAMSVEVISEGLKQIFPKLAGIA